MPTRENPYVDRIVASASLGRAVLLGRAVATLTAAGAGLRLVTDPSRLLAVLVIVVATTVAGLAIVARRPQVVRYPLPIVVLDTLIVLGILAISGAGVAYFCCAVGSCALAGVLLGLRALPLCALHVALGYAVAAGALESATVSPDVTSFIFAFPMANVLAGIGAAVAAAALMRYVNLSVETVASAQRSAAASERARLARELHDSVAKTLHGVSFAALALPNSLRRHPALAEQLAGTVSEGAKAAALQAQDLLEGLRADEPDEDFKDTLRGICRDWSNAGEVEVLLTADAVNPPVTMRYELSRILQEALRNVAQHARAGSVNIVLTRTSKELELEITDDGRGFRLPPQGASSHGIIGMRERMQTLNGTLEIDSEPGKGTTIRATAPWPL